MHSTNFIIILIIMLIHLFSHLDCFILFLQSALKHEDGEDSSEIPQLENLRYFHVKCVHL